MWRDVAKRKKRGEKKDVYGGREDKQISLLSQEKKKERAKPISMSHPINWNSSLNKDLGFRIHRDVQ